MRNWNDRWTIVSLQSQMWDGAALQIPSIGRHEQWFGPRRFISNLKILYIPGVLNFCFPLNLTNGQPRKPGTYSCISQPSPKMPTLSFDGGSHLGVPWRGALLGRAGGNKNNIQRPLNILKVVIRSAWSRHHCKEWGPSRCSLSS